MSGEAVCCSSTMSDACLADVKVVVKLTVQLGKKQVKAKNISFFI
jgi:hypothetical protein